MKQHLKNISRIIMETGESFLLSRQVVCEAEVTKSRPSGDNVSVSQNLISTLFKNKTTLVARPSGDNVSVYKNLISTLFKNKTTLVARPSGDNVSVSQNLISTLFKNKTTLVAMMYHTHINLITLLRHASRIQ